MQKHPFPLVLSQIYGVAATANSTVVLRKNGANGNETFSIGANATGAFTEMVMYPIVRTNSLSTFLTIESHKQVIVEISIINPNVCSSAQSKQTVSLNIMK